MRGCELLYGAASDEATPRWSTGWNSGLAAGAARAAWSLSCSSLERSAFARKLLLALGLGRHAWALVLDEPTNHLDLPTIERLEEALRLYPGALLLVTHDEALAARTTRSAWRVAGGRVRVC